MNAWHHSVSSAKKFGGNPEDYMEIHQWFDASKEFFANFRHRALRHHAQGIFEAERKFGPVLVNSAGKTIPTRFIGEQHVKEDCGFIPSLQDWLSRIDAEPWMHAKPQGVIAKELHGYSKPEAPKSETIVTSVLADLPDRTLTGGRPLVGPA